MLRLINNDNIAEMQKMDECSVDVVVTSPPYNKLGLRNGNVGTNGDWSRVIFYDKYQDNMPEEKYWAWQADVIRNIARVLKVGGSLFYNHKVRRFKNIAYHPLQGLAGHQLGLDFHQEIIWDRKNSFNGNSSFLTPSVELVLWYSKGKPRVYKNQLPKEHRGEIWSIPSKHNSEHPAPFPPELAERCILLTTKEEDLVLDPFCGEANSGIAALRTNRNYIGIDISEQYLQMAYGNLHGRRIDKTSNAGKQRFVQLPIL